MADDFCNIMKSGASVNFYMLHGGTNFGFMAGANWFEPKKESDGFFKGGYKSDITSYGRSLTFISSPVRKYRKSYCSHHGIGVRVAQMLKFLVKVFVSLYLLNFFMDQVDTFHVGRYWS